MPIYDACADQPTGAVEIAYCKTRQTRFEKRTENHDLAFICVLKDEINKSLGKEKPRRIMIYIDGKKSFGCEINEDEQNQRVDRRLQKTP